MLKRIAMSKYFKTSKNITAMKYASGWYVTDGYVVIDPVCVTESPRPLDGTCSAENAAAWLRAAFPGRGESVYVVRDDERLHNSILGITEARHTLRKTDFIYTGDVVYKRFFCDDAGNWNLIDDKFVVLFDVNKIRTPSEGLSPARRLVWIDDDHYFGVMPCTIEQSNSDGIDHFYRAISGAEITPKSVPETTPEKLDKMNRKMMRRRIA